MTSQKTTARVAIVTDSRGTLLDHVFAHSTFLENLGLVVTDGECGAVAVARKYGLPCRIISEPDNLSLSDRIATRCRDAQIDYIFSIFSRLFRGELLQAYANRIVNLHPSLLPAFPGMGSLDKSLDSGVRYLGATVHVVDGGVDTGPIIAQTITHWDGRDRARAIHRCFQAQCQLTLQALNYLVNGRLRFVDGRVDILGAAFGPGEFSPLLDDPGALSLDIPFPGRACRDGEKVTDSDQMDGRSKTCC
ncbi:MAG: hypothetical protein MI747_03410 [Desulfobacterales bacterium]|nr:hypothetical protein [Desulfobacterales bacterium]